MEDRFRLNRQLQDKYNTNEDFRFKMNSRLQDFKDQKAILATQHNLQIRQQLLQIFAFQNDYETFFYYGFMQPKSKHQSSKLKLYLIKNFNPRFHKKYKFVFFNNCVSGNQIYYEFKNIFLTLPLQYFLALDEFIFVKPSFSQKVFQWWTSDEVEKYFKVKTRYINDISELCPILDTNMQRLIESLPRQIVSAQFPQKAQSLPSKQMDLTTYRINLQGQSRTHEEQQKFNSFLKMMGNFYQNSKNQPIQIDEYEVNEAKLPVILQELFSYFDQHPQKIKEQGLFRKSVSIDEENETLEELMRSNFQYLKKVANSHLIANLIKRFFAKLKTPIFPYSTFEKLMHDQGVSDKLSLVKQQISDLPPKNYFPLMFLFQFLIEKILPQEKYTKMNQNNLAICFAPCLLKSQKPSQLDLIYATKSSHVVKLILQNFSKIFGTKAQRQMKVRQLVKDERQRWQNQLKYQIQSLSQSESKSDRSYSEL